jgi:ADP-heptose:LPS heptosyltransferase
MRGDDNFCADWLWLHKRWKISTDPRKRLALRTPRHDLLAENIAALHLDACPRNEHFWVRLPRNLAGAIRTIPLLRALRRSRPDAALTLLVDAALAPLFEATGLGERVIALPAPTAPADEFRAFFKQQRTKYPDTWIVFPEDAGADLEARLAGAPQRFGMITAGGPLARRPNLTHVWRVPKGVDLQRVHQSLLWELWLKSAHGLDADADFSPLRLDTPKASAPLLSLLIGGDGDRRRTWSAGDWAEFIRQLRTTRPDVRLRLLGARCDQPLAEKITAALADTGTGATGTAGTGTAGTGTAAGSIQNWTGQLEITAAARALAESHAVVGTDNGLLRLANLLGVPAVALFVSTNPLRTAPNFTAPLILLQPSQSGTAGITGITTENVRIAAETLLH